MLSLWINLIVLDLALDKRRKAFIQLFGVAEAGITKSRYSYQL